MNERDKRELLDRAIAQVDKAYAPYSHCKVAAVLMTEDGSIFEGVNIENASFGATNCAERTAIFSAVTAGHQVIKAIAVASNLDQIITPCGICRQVMTEFCDDDCLIILGDEHALVSYTLASLLPNSFDQTSLEEGRVKSD